MPHTVRKRTGKRPYKIVKTTTGKQVGSSISRAKAESSIKHRRHRGKK